MIKRIFNAWLITIFTTFTVAASAAEPSTPIKVACVGDSITFGGGARDKSSYPNQLGIALGDKWTVENFGVGGATLLKSGDNPYWNLARYTAAQKYQPNVVIIKLGTNDSKPWNWEFKDDFITDYVELIKNFKNLDSKPTVWIAYPVPAYSSAWGISGEVITYEIIPMIDEIAKQANVNVIDLYSALSGKNELFPDGIHPEANGKRLIGKTIARAIKDN